MGKYNKSRNSNNYKYTNQLVSRARKGDMKAFSKLCESEGRRIVFLCTKIMGNQQDGEDAAQEVFIKMQKDIHMLRTVESFTVWINRIIVNTCNNLQKKEKRIGIVASIDDFAEIMPDEEDACIPQKYAENNEKKQELLHIVDELPIGMRTCVYLYYFEELAVAEIADILEVPQQAVNNQLYRARLKMRIKIKEQMSAEDERGTLMPMSALGSFFQQQAAQTITAKTIIGCMGGAGLKSVTGVAANLAIGIGGKSIAAAVAAVAGVSVSATLVVVGLVLPSRQASDEFFAGAPPQCSVQEIVETEAGLEDILSVSSPSIEEMSSQVVSRPVVSPKLPVGEVPLEKGLFVNGNIKLENYGSALAGEEEQGEWRPQDVNGMQVNLHAPDNTLVGNSAVSPEGTFSIGFSNGLSPNIYRAQLVLPENSPLLFSGKTVTGIALLEINAYENSYTLTFFVRRKPVEVEYEKIINGENCLCGHVNPQFIEIKAKGSQPLNIEWFLQEKATGKVVSSGTGSHITNEQFFKNVLQEGRYTFMFRPVGAGYSAMWDSIEILKVHGHIDPNQYA